MLAVLCHMEAEGIREEQENVRYNCKIMVE